MLNSARKADTNTASRHVLSVSLLYAPPVTLTRSEKAAVCPSDISLCGQCAEQREYELSLEPQMSNDQQAFSWSWINMIIFYCEYCAIVYLQVYKTRTMLLQGRANCKHKRQTEQNRDAFNVSFKSNIQPPDTAFGAPPCLSPLNTVVTS
ncbi:hypothetical protein F2P81_003465 [Scophthalmus maximus]|uniref:Uncharacterized protein n=1 Tax=Scophthalmus maximus TaxID=52904 RepID=A0A6A4TCS9_SCOMX|nr:hypothetical protein F2P81_003465 [Scophthalmus maximus]